MRLSLLALAALIASCGGSGASATPSTSAVVALSPSASATASTTPITFAELVRVGASSNYRITYIYRVTQNAQEQTVTSTWYVRPPEMRWDFASPLGGSSSFFFRTDGSYICSGVGQPSCVRLASAAAMQQTSGALVQQLVRDHPERFTASASADRVFAGLRARCFEVNDVSAQFGRGTLCYSNDGLPLFSRFVWSGGEFAMEATDVSTSVTDADLALPGPVQATP